MINMECCARDACGIPPAGIKKSEWDELKSRGSLHYRTWGVQPIDLYRDLGILRPFALASIIKYAARNVGNGPDADPVSNRDMDKIIHYAELLKAACGAGE